MKNKIINISIILMLIFTSLISVEAIAATPRVDLNDYEIITNDVNSVYVSGTVSIAKNQNVGLYDSTGRLPYTFITVGNSGSKESFKIQVPARQLNEGTNTFKVKSTPVKGVINGSNPKTLTVKINNSKKKNQTITAGDILLKVKENKNINAKVNSGLPLTYKSGNTNIATVNDKGEVIGRNPGTTKITITQSGNSEYLSATKDITITVKKEEPIQIKEYTITYNANGGKGSMSKKTVKEGTKITLANNAFTRNGYTFKGWSTKKDGSVVYKNKQVITVTSNITLYAVWKNNKVFLNKNVLVLGDSIQAGHGKYTVVAANKLGAKKVTNKSVAGRTVSYVKGKAAKTNSIIYQLKHDSWYKNNIRHYKYVLIVAGTNDYAWGAISSNRLKADTTSVIKYLRKYNKNSTIIVVTPLRRWSGKTEKTGVEKYRKKMIEATKGFDNIYIVDGKQLVDTKEYSKFPDRLHPTTSFAEKTLSKRLVTKIQKLLI